MMLVSPLTFMNLSGQSVRPFVDFYKLPLEDIVVICDDLSLPVGKLRLKGKGSSGGQNGLKSIIGSLGSDVFPRLRIGIGQPPGRWDPADYVLGQFAANDKEPIQLAVQLAADAVELWAKEDLTAAMNRFNVKSEKKTSQPKKKPAVAKNPTQPALVDPVVRAEQSDPTTRDAKADS